MLLIWGINGPHLFLTGMSWTSTNTTWQLSSVHRPIKSSPFCIPLISDHFWDSIGGKAASPLLATNRTISRIRGTDMPWYNYRMTLFGGRDVQKCIQIWICEALSAAYEHVSCRVSTKTSRKTLCFVPGFRRKNTVSNAISLKHKKESRKKISPPNGGEVLKSKEITKIFA